MGRSLKDRGLSFNVRRLGGRLHRCLKVYREVAILTRMPQYEYTLSFELAEDCPPTVGDFFRQLAGGAVPNALPEVDEQALECSSADVIALLTGATLANGWVTIVGRVEAAAFYMPFMALCEWLARWSATRAPAGYYHQPSLAHPTLVYFANGKPFMLQATGTPIGMVDGKEMLNDKTPNDQ